MIFHIYRTKKLLRKEQWYFHAKRANGEIILTSEPYSTYSAARKTIRLIQQEAATSVIK